MARSSSRVCPRILDRRLFSTFGLRAENQRPAKAPRQTPDLKSIRFNVELYQQNTVQRNYERHGNSPRRIAELTELSSLAAKASIDPRRELKKLEKNLVVHRGKGDNDEVKAILEQIKPLRKAVDSFDKQKSRLDEEARALALALPNLTSPETPIDGQFKVLRYLNYDDTKPPIFPSGADHSVIGQKLGILDFASASTASGWGFYYLLDEAARLEHALIDYAITVAQRYGWRIVTPPSLVYSHIADSCGFQPRDANDEQQIWQIAQAIKDGSKPKRSLAATAEIPLAALYAGRDIAQAKLPIKMAGHSRCYRAEAGARGVGTKGLYRVHEFSKVEMFAWADALDGDNFVEHSSLVFNEMLDLQVEILSSLGLPCRVLEMPTSDLGASAYRKIDIETLFPSRLQRDGGWGELSSVSICTDYQSRRLDTRILDPSGARSRFPHTINGTALAVPRVLAAILEHGWNAETKSVTLPEVLRSRMGIESIGPR